jgi:hypothetical protein
MDTAERNYVESMIERAQAATRTALEVVESHGLAAVAAELSWSLDFQRFALAELATGMNEDGTFGPSHITTEGRELHEPPQG